MEASPDSTLASSDFVETAEQFPSSNSSLNDTLLKETSIPFEARLPLTPS
jgi:hypothetical protein